ncbi:hypothetical protein CaCOL14_003780 [Colletotrichum acutatum]
MSMFKWMSLSDPSQPLARRAQSHTSGSSASCKTLLLWSLYTANAVALSGQRHIQHHAPFRPNQHLLHLRPQFPCVYPPVVPLTLALMAVSRRQCNRQAPSPTMGRVENSGTLFAPPSPGPEFNTIRH